MLVVGIRDLPPSPTSTSCTQCSRPPFQLTLHPPQVFPVQTCRTSHPPRPERPLPTPLQLPRPPAHRLPMHPHPPRHLRRPYPCPQQPRGSNPPLLQCR